MKTATLELYEFVENRIKAIEETIVKKGMSLTLEGELIAYNEMKEEILRVAKDIEKPMLIKLFLEWNENNGGGKPSVASWYFNKTFKTCPTP